MITIIYYIILQLARYVYCIFRFQFKFLITCEINYCESHRIYIYLYHASLVQLSINLKLRYKCISLDCCKASTLSKKKAVMDKFTI